MLVGTTAVAAAAVAAAACAAAAVAAGGGHVVVVSPLWSPLWVADVSIPYTFAPAILKSSFAFSCRSRRRMNL